MTTTNIRPAVSHSANQLGPTDRGTVVFQETSSPTLRWMAGLMISLCFLSCADHQDAATPAAQVALVNTSGANVGVAQLTQDSQGIVTLRVTVSGLPSGTHGIHFHEVGLADPAASPAFSTAGEHYNPASRKHGISNPQGTHAGDLANIEVDATGKGLLVTTTDRVSLSAGPTTLFDNNGTSLIIHANGDDQVSDPSGNSGGRIAGGVVELAK
jgi:superoxide dismutase, Cu-Zn family